MLAVLSPITARLVKRRRRPSIVRRQNRSVESPDRFSEVYQRDALTCCGCESQVSASHTLMSTKYEVIGRFGIRAGRSPLRDDDSSSGSASKSVRHWRRNSVTLRSFMTLSVQLHVQTRFCAAGYWPWVTLR